MSRSIHLIVILFLVAALNPAGAQQSPAKSAVSSNPAASKKPLGVPADAKFFNGKWYHVYLDACRWKAARDKCTRVGGQLVVVPDAATQAYVRSLAKGLRLWLGATDEKVEGLWVWVDGSEMNYKSWDRRQPNNMKRDEHFLETYPSGNWNDNREDAQDVVGYICEWKAK